MRGVALPPTLENIIKTTERAVNELDADISSIERYEQLVNLVSLVSDSVPQTYQAVLDALCDIMDAEAGYIAEPSDSGWQVTYTKTDATLQRFGDFVFDRIINRFETQKEVIATENFTYADLNERQHFKIRSLLIIPVWIGNEPLAGFYLEQQLKRGYWNHEDERPLIRALPVLTHILQVTQQLADN